MQCKLSLSWIQPKPGKHSQRSLLPIQGRPALLSHAEEARGPPRTVHQGADELHRQAEPRVGRGQAGQRPGQWALTS